MTAPTPSEHARTDARAVCATCRWWHVYEYAMDVGYGMYVQVKETQCRIRSLPTFPERNPDGWCGEHAPTRAERGEGP